MAKYDSQIEGFYKAGSKHIGRLSILEPLWQETNQLIFINAIATHDSNSSSEGNLGLGYRTLNNERIWGGYMYYDFRSTRHSNVVQQFTMGVEYLRESFEVRINNYLPIGKTSFVIDSETLYSPIAHDSSNIYIDFSKTSTVERSFSGIDGEVGVNLDKIKTNCFIGGYYFTAKSRKIIGPQIRVEVKPLPWLTFSTEIKYDRTRKVDFYFGTGFRFSILSNNSLPFSLEGKMTQMPVRDIDIVESTETEVFEGRNIFTVVTNAAELDNAMNRKETHIAIAEDIDFAGATKSYGTLATPIEDSHITGVDITKDVSGNITSVAHANKKLHNFLLPHNPRISINMVDTTPSIIPVAIFNYIANSQVSFLTVDNWRLTSMNDPAAGLVGLATGNSNIHHNLNLNDIRKNSAGIVGLIKDTTIVQHNENRGDISNGFVGPLFSAGIVHSAADKCIIQHNKNIGIVGGAVSGGIIHKMYGNNIVRYNENRGSISNSAAGIVYESSRGGQIEFNRNRGDIYGAGIIFVAYKNSIISNNISFGRVRHPNAGPIANFRDNTVSVNNNFWLINDPADRNRPAILSTPGFIQTNGGALTIQEMRDRGLLD